MLEKEWIEKDWRTLLSSIQRQNCILLLGPDVYDEGVGPENASLTRQLAAELLRDLDLSEARRAELARCELPVVAQQYAFQEGRSDLETRAVDFYEEHHGDQSDIHDKLADVPFYFTITSCHDNLYETALRNAGRQPTVAHYHFRGEKQSYVAMATPQAPLVYHLYGGLQQPQSMVLTENDLLNFLVAVVSENPALPSSIRSELQRKAKSFLFVGFGLRHWYLRILLHVLKFNQLESRSFALETLAASEGDLDQAIIFYRTGYAIDIFRSEIRQFVHELHRRTQERGLTVEAAAAVQSPVTLLGPKVFISHTSEDFEKATLAHSVFKAHGVEAWLDTEHLSPGQQWNEVIQARIADADYFVILNSANLEQKRRGYVNTELKLALEQQSAIRGLPYITPVLVDDEEIIAELRPYHAVPARTEADFAKLVSSLKREFQLRGRTAQ